MSTTDAAQRALYRARQLKAPGDWATFSLAEIEAIREHARQEGRAAAAKEHAENVRDIAATVSPNDSHAAIVARFERLARGIEKGGE